MIRFNGTHENLGDLYKNSLAVDTEKFEFTCGFFSVYDKCNKRVKLTMDMNASNTPQISYYTQRDNSGGLYEMIRFNSYDESWYSDTIIGNNRIYSKEVQIQTWDRKELFITFTYQHKRECHGRYRATSDVETCIFMMDEKSIKLFSGWIESIIAQKGK